MAEDFLTETFDFVNREGLQELWQRAKRKFFVKTDNIAGTEYDGVDANLKALSEITSGETSSVHKLGLVRRTNGAPANTWVLDDTKYVIGASISASGIVLDRINPDGTEEETDKPLISMQSIKTAIGLKSAAYLEANNTAGNIPLLDSNGHLSIGVIPDAILGQVLFGGTISGTEGGSYPVIGNTYISTNAKTKIEKKTGKEIGTRKLQLVNVPQSQAGTWTTSTAYVGYDACEGIYFIFSVTGPFTFAGEEYNVGDWIISTGSAWKKVDNTDAVTGIKFVRNGVVSVEIGEVTVSCDKIGALNLFATTPQNMLGDLIVGTSSSRKSIAAYGGMAAHGIGDLTSGGGGGGTSGVEIMLDWTNYTGADTEVLSSRLGIKGMTLTASKLTLTKGNNTVIEQNVPAWNQNTTGNAATADKVNHTLTFGSKTYDGSAAKTLLLSDLATYSNNKYAINISGNADTATYAGNAATASALQTARSITIGSETHSFDGSANISFSLATIGAQAVIADVSDSVNGYVSKVTQTNGKIGVTHASFAKPAITLSATKMKITTDGGNSDEVTIPTWNQDTTGSAAKLTNARKITIGHTYNSFDGSGDISYNLSDVGALDLYMTSKQTMLGDLEIGTSSSAKGLSAWGGVAAHGIGDLTSGGGGGGTSGVEIMLDWNGYTGADTEVLSSRLGIKGMTLTASKLTLTKGNNSVIEQNIPTWNQSTTGNAATATTASNYASSGTIKSFVELSSSVMQSLQSQIDSIASRSHFDELLVSVLTADVITAGTVYGAFIGDISGNADTATKLKTARTITIGNKANSFDGSGNIAFALDDIGVEMEIYAESATDEPAGMTLRIGDKEIDVRVLTDEEIDQICN